jgi:hypothetical protein
VSDKVLVVARFQIGAETFQQIFKQGQLLLPLSSAVTALSQWHIATTGVVEMNIGAADPVLVEVNTVDPSHVHESHAPGPAQLVFEW